MYSRMKLVEAMKQLEKYTEALKMDGKWGKVKKSEKSHMLG